MPRSSTTEARTTRGRLAQPRTRGRRRPLLRRLAIAALCLALLLSPVAVLLLATVHQDRPVLADAILLAGSDADGRGEEEAARLFRAGWAPRIALIERPLLWHMTTADPWQRHLVALGVPPSKLLRLPVGDVTPWTEADSLGRQMQALRWRRVLVVTSELSSGRTRYLQSRAWRRYHVVGVYCPFAHGSDRSRHARIQERVYSLLNWPVDLLWRR